MFSKLNDRETTKVINYACRTMTALVNDRKRFRKIIREQSIAQLSRRHLFPVSDIHIEYTLSVNIPYSKKFINQL